MKRLRVLAAASLLLPVAACSAGGGELMATPKPMSPPPATMVHVHDVRVGMCLDAGRLPEDGLVTYLEVLDCSIEHTGEVHLVQDGTAAAPGTLPDGSPCRRDYQAYVGSHPDTTGNEIRALSAPADALAGRPVPLVCVTVTPTPTIGSVRGTGT